MLEFLHGALAALLATVGMFFLRFYLTSRDRLFLFFSLAFFFFCANYVGLGIAKTSLESRHYVYVLRLVAFILIIVGILDKNRRERAS
ncbi:MAG: hypothetical protein HOW73_44340 [Polyangiaceae bacterium]|nr:hypothetical protein [Polyangiaceae bacterium]